MPHYTTLEARKKLCPFMGKHCLTAECSAWQWDEEGQPGRRFIDAVVLNAQEEVEAKGGLFGASTRGLEFVPADCISGSGAGWIEPLHEYHARCTGFCGAFPQTSTRVPQ
ncbi:hypothetical protein [Plasticicumulans acidivorans]|uniref:Uncharacterized protein n=1 Tax=Plasticicumulans acidivorans TaxID=886464 RepID=A0A317N0C4_9GAMM|nr:hypothetical protein [Plasticicumulans acidivorans]PWV66021.1 hypothetical protein C7443_101509 [Plasticicumulans acidivorans]